MPLNCTLSKVALTFYWDEIHLKAYEVVLLYVKPMKRQKGGDWLHLWGQESLSESLRFSLVVGFIWPRRPSAAGCSSCFLWNYKEARASPVEVGLHFRVRPQSTGCVGCSHCQHVCYFDSEAGIKGYYQRTACSLSAHYRPGQHPWRPRIYWTGTKGSLLCG